MMSVGERIVLLRKKQGLTQAKLAKLAGLSTSAIAMYETNRRQPDTAAVQAISAALGVKPHELLSHSAAERRSVSVGTTAQVRETTPNPALQSTDAQPTLTTLALSRDEARIILFLRMNPASLPFIQTYVMADQKKREQLERAWKLIQEFQA